MEFLFILIIVGVLLSFFGSEDTIKRRSLTNLEKKREEQEQLFLEQKAKENENDRKISELINKRLNE